MSKVSDKLKPELQAIFKKHHVDIFELFHVAEFTYRLRTTHVCEPQELINDLKDPLGGYSKIIWSYLDVKAESLAAQDIMPKVLNVNHPAHYNSGKIEVIEAIEDWGLNFHRGNAVKYTARAGKKDLTKELEDLEKAVWYLKREIEVLKARAEKRAVVRPNDMNPRA